ncbi:hypothetical protein [Halobacterium litoreum]|uniref:Uncharacterized protein n=1 Tax=Halobacterium litoreum TaxID=2039234 RepID=A0ABD5NDN4_9EURY|nr:hypothetical protein [Halobacterium litoreum]UHH13857.1 hypothetical protein LT972_02400 [Halobacterium litoreum]
MHRRTLLTTAAAGTTAALAGCLGGSGGDGDAPDSDANPRDLLPTAPDGWTRSDVQQQSAGMVGAEAGFGASYHTAEDVRYAVEVLRWPSSGDANSEAPDVYDSWPVLVTTGNFSFAGKGPDVGAVETLLGESSALTVEYVQKNDQN